MFNPCQDRAKHMLLEHQVILEEFGGDVQAVPISALTVSPSFSPQNMEGMVAELISVRAQVVGLES